MERLPPELLAPICSFSDTRSLKKIRLVNKTFADIAAKFLFETLCVTLIPRYLHKVTEVAYHPTLRFHVHTLAVSYDILDQKFAEHEIWKAEVDKTEYPNVHYVQANRDRCYTYTCNLIAEQKAFFDDRMDLAMLSAALAMLPNLQNIESKYETCPVHGRNNVPVPMLSDLQWNTLLKNPFIGPTRSRQPGLARPLVSLLSGLGLTRKQILKMEMNDIPWSFWKEDCPSGIHNSALQLIQVAFRHLESMTACIVVDAYDLEFSMQGIMPPSITSFLGTAHSLRRLELEFQCREDCDVSAFEGANWIARTPRAGPLFATLTLPSLAMLTIANCKLTEESFIGFIRRHATSLKSLDLIMIDLDNQSAEPTSWERVWKQLAPRLDLDVIDLSGTVDDDNFQEVACDGDLDLNPYYNALETFIYYRGQTKCPKWSEFYSWGKRLLLAPDENNSDMSG